MRTRTALTIGVLGTAGAISTYLYSRPSLRKKMMKAPSAHDAAVVFAEQIEEDAADIAKHVKHAALHNWLMDELKRSSTVAKTHLTRGIKHVKKDVKAVKRDSKDMVKEMQPEKKHVEHALKAASDKAIHATAAKVGA